MRTSRLAVLTSILSAGLIAGCGSSSHSSSSAQPAAATVQSSSSASTASPAAAVIATKHAKLGTVLAYGPRHLTAYLFEGDSGSHSACTGQCAQVWPPVTGKPSAGAGAVSADLGTIKRSDGTLQVTYKGHPLYGFAKDRDDGDAYGQALTSFGAEWYALAASGEKVEHGGGQSSGAQSSSSSSGYSAGGGGY